MSSDFQKTVDTLSVSGEASFLTRGGSMRPLFREHRDVINIVKITNPLKRGDVVLYPSEHLPELVLHRIVKVNGDNLVIRGDNNCFTEYRKKSEMVGIMESFFREGKFCKCDSNFLYKLYTFCILNSYHLRCLWRLKLKPFLRKIKRALFKLLKIKQ